MTNTAHHPSSDLLLSYSAGSASPSQALCVATHLEYCQSCRAAHQRNNVVGGKLLEQIQNSHSLHVSASARAKVLDNLDTRPQPGKSTDQTVENSTPIPRALRRLVPKSFEALDWQMISATAQSCRLFKDGAGTTVSLLKLKPGGRIAKHRHTGDEYTVVLTGAFSDESGVYRAGDFLLCDTEGCHSPVATKDAECICLTLQEAPLQFTGWFFRMLNPWVRNQFQTT